MTRDGRSVFHLHEADADGDTVLIGDVTLRRITPEDDYLFLERHIWSASGLGTFGQDDLVTRWDRTYPRKIPQHPSLKSSAPPVLKLLSALPWRADCLDGYKVTTADGRRVFDVGEMTLDGQAALAGLVGYGRTTKGFLRYEWLVWSSKGIGLHGGDDLICHRVKADSNEGKTK
jgi:hypothetical protein